MKYIHSIRNTRHINSSLSKLFFSYAHFEICSVSCVLHDLYLYVGTLKKGREFVHTKSRCIYIRTVPGINHVRNAQLHGRVVYEVEKGRRQFFRHTRVNHTRAHRVFSFLRKVNVTMIGRKHTRLIYQYTLLYSACATSAARTFCAPSSSSRTMSTPASPSPP